MGYKPEELFVPAARRFILDGITYDVPADPNAFEKMLVQKFPEDERSIRAFFDDARAAFQEIHDPDLKRIYGIPRPAMICSKHFRSEQLKLYGQKSNRKLDWLNKTFQEKMDQYITNPQVQRLLCSLLGYIGASRLCQPFLYL